MKIHHRARFSILAYFCPKNIQNWPKMKKIGKFQIVWWNFLKFLYVNASQQNKKKKYIYRFRHFWLFLAKKNSQNWQKWWILAKSKPYDKIFWNLVCKCLLVNENWPQSPIFDFGLFFYLKNSQNQPKMKKIGKIKTVWCKFLKFGK